MSLPATSNTFRIASAPTGAPTAANATFAQEPLPSAVDLAEGQFIVRNKYLSVDPTHRIYWTLEESYLPAFKVGDKMMTVVLGEVVASRLPAAAVGATVEVFGAWEEYTVADASKLLGVVDAGIDPLAYISVANPVIGLTAWHGVNKIFDVKAGDYVCVSGAAGAVGSLVVQLAKLKGAKVAGIAGSEDKCAFVRSLGADIAVNYKDAAWAEQLKAFATDKFDHYFESVGGDVTQTVLGGLMKLFGKVALCGIISGYNGDAKPFNVWPTVLMRRLKVTGFICLDHIDEAPEAFGELMGLLKDGKLQFKTHVMEGSVETVIDGLNALLTGKNTGKGLIQLY